MLKARFRKYRLHFKRPSGTSRGVMQHKDSWFIFLQDSTDPDIFGIGECGILKGLSVDPFDSYEAKLQELCDDINQHGQWSAKGLIEFPSIRFGLEIALKDLAAKGSKLLFESAFTQENAPIPINGLIWMGEKDFMFEQIKVKLKAGFDCLKLKIGAIDFEAELDLLHFIRSKFSPKDLEIRVDANGAFLPKEAMTKLEQLATFNLHSIEQPIRQGQWSEMAALCQATPIPIALDEELIGIKKLDEKKQLIETIQPQYLIFKPSLIGGFAATEEWIELCTKNDIAWWLTSALESNIGLNAISQWTATLDNKMPQGLGTGQLYTNNFQSPLSVRSGNIFYDSDKAWDLDLLFDELQ